MALRVQARIMQLLAEPWRAFVFLSVLFGPVLLAANPPLRAPDEAAHFIRIYGIAQGDIVPSYSNEEGRKGIFIPAHLSAEIAFFDEARRRMAEEGVSYGEIMRDYLGQTRSHDAPVFAAYQGGESYTPVPYLPAVAVTWVISFFDAGFLTLFYAMRFAGFAAMTAVAAYAMAAAPHLKWSFLVIAMLPSALYGRAVLSADGAAVSFALVVTALTLRAVCGTPARQAGERALFMLLCVLSKVPHVAFVVLESASGPFRTLAQRWRAVALIVLPGLILTAAWIAATSADVGIWRYVASSGKPEEFFSLSRKVALTFSEPMRFPTRLAASFDVSELQKLGRELIGVFGWLDTQLRSWVYPVLGALLAAACFAPLPLERAVRIRVASVALLTLAGYTLAVYLIFYLTWTPLDVPRILGVQGRYFVPILPVAALALSATVNRGPGARTASLIGWSAAILSGAVSVDAILRANG